MFLEKVQEIIFIMGESVLGELSEFSGITEHGKNQMKT